jgi:hypothetical protein
MAAELHVTPKIIEADRKALGLPTGMERRAIKEASSIAERDAKIKALHDAGDKQVDIAEELNVSPSVVSTTLRKLGKSSSMKATHSSSSGGSSRSTPHTRSRTDTGGKGKTDSKQSDSKLTDSQREAVFDFYFEQGIRDVDELHRRTGAGPGSIWYAIEREKWRREGYAEAQEEAAAQQPVPDSQDQQHYRFQALDGHAHIFKCTECGTLEVS